MCVVRCGLKPGDIEAYYTWMRKNGKTEQECEHHHVNIRRALRMAFKKEWVKSIPADMIDRPKSPPYSAKYYNEEELKIYLMFLKETGSSYYIK